jgi:hypothetical protein
MPNRNRSWPYQTGQATSPPALVQTPTALLSSARSLGGPLRLGTEPNVGPRGAPDGAFRRSDLEMDRIAPRRFDPIGTSWPDLRARQISEISRNGNGRNNGR